MIKLKDLLKEVVEAKQKSVLDDIDGERISWFYRPETTGLKRFIDQSW